MELEPPRRLPVTLLTWFDRLLFKFTPSILAVSESGFFIAPIFPAKFPDNPVIELILPAVSKTLSPDNDVDNILSRAGIFPAILPSPPPVAWLKELILAKVPRSAGLIVLFE